MRKVNKIPPGNMVSFTRWNADRWRQCCRQSVSRMRQHERIDANESMRARCALDSALFAAHRLNRANVRHRLLARPHFKFHLK